jgi:RHS repeat-associated protein
MDQRLRLDGEKIVEIRLPDGRAQYYFDDNADGIYEAVLPVTKDSWVERVVGVGYRRVLRAGGAEVYDSAGKLLSLTDPAGVVTTYDRDAAGRLLSVTRLSRTMTFSYEGGSERPTQVLGPGGAVLVSYTYNQSNDLESVTYPDGSGYRFSYALDSYSNNPRVVSVVDAAGNLIEAHSYDTVGRATTSELAGGREKLTFSYGAGQTTVTDALGNQTVYEHRPILGMRRVTKVTGPCPSCGGGGGDVQEWTYDDVGNVTSYKNGAGDVWTYTYTTNYQLSTETDPLGHTTSYTYTAEGRMESRTGPDGSFTSYTYGPAGPLTVSEKVSAAETRTTSYTYTPQGQLWTTTDARGKLTTRSYNPEGNLGSLTDPLGHTTTYGYDDLGRRTSVTDPLGHTVMTTYDGAGRATRIINPDATHTDFTYDRSGRRTGVTDPLGRTTSYAYDSYGWLTAVVDPANGVTRYGYDLMGHLVSLTDAKGQATVFEYDGQGHVAKVTYPGGAFEGFTYDGAGRLATKTDRKGTVTSYSYDPLGRLLGKTYSDGTPAVSYTYDSAGRLRTATNGTDTLTWDYDLAGQLLGEQSSRNGSTVAYTYDGAGNRLSVGLDGQVFVTYAYDDASRLSTITKGASVFGFAYDEANRRASLTYPNGITTSYAYDSLNRLTSLHADLAPTSVTSFAYTYDDAGNRTSKAQIDYAEAYSYDRLYRLTGVERTGGLTGRWHWGYDPVGNRTSSQLDNAITTATYNERNQLLGSTGGGPLKVRGVLDEPGTVKVNGQPAAMLAGNTFEATIPAVPGTNTFTVDGTDLSGNVSSKNYQVEVTGLGASYTYDPNGNLTTKTEGTDTWVYTWNAENQLTKVEKNSVEQARFGYDPLGRRVEKIAGGVTTSYVYDLFDLLRETRGGVTLKYVHGTRVDEPVAREDGTGTLTYYHADDLGSVSKLTNQAGAVVHEYRYDAWGKIETGASEPGFAFTGREWDVELGLYYYRARYYDPSAGRFLSEDFVGHPGRSLYAYVDNSPATFTDPLGLLKWGGIRIVEEIWPVGRTQPGDFRVKAECDGECGNYRVEFTVAPYVIYLRPSMNCPDWSRRHEMRHARLFGSAVVAALAPLHAAEGKTYGSKAECEAAAAKAKAAADNVYQREMQKAYFHWVFPFTVLQYVPCHLDLS